MPVGAFTQTAPWKQECFAATSAERRPAPSTRRQEQARNHNASWGRWLGSFWLVPDWDTELHARIQNQIQEFGASMSSPDLQSYQSTCKLTLLTPAPTTIRGGYWKQPRVEGL